MLTRHAKTYSSFCSQNVSLSPAISLQFIFRVCGVVHCSPGSQKSIKTPYFESSGSFKVISVSMSIDFGAIRS